MNTRQSPVSVPDNEDIRFSTRTWGKNLENMLDRAINVTKNRNMEGNSNHYFDVDVNSFADLSDMEIVYRASLMGVSVHSNNFESINLIRKLECARDNLCANPSGNIGDNLHIRNINSGVSPVCITWLSSSDAEKYYDEELFTVVRSRKDRKK
jgi:hypothetical protein